MFTAIASGPARGARPLRSSPGSQRAGKRAERRRRPRLTSPPSHHSRAPRLNLVPSVTAPNSGHPGPRLLATPPGLGACGEFRVSIGQRLAARWPRPCSSARPLEGDLEDARERAPAAGAEGAAEGRVARTPGPWSRRGFAEPTGSSGHAGVQPPRTEKLAPCNCYRLSCWDGVKEGLLLRICIPLFCKQSLDS